MAKVTPLRSMELDDEVQFEMAPVAPGMDKPRFPYGLKICLEDAQLKELELSPEDCCIGGLIHLHAMGRITSVSQNDTDGGKRCRVEIQIESMCCVEAESIEDEEAEEEMEGDKSSRRSRLYDKAAD